MTFFKSRFCQHILCTVHRLTESTFTETIEDEPEEVRHAWEELVLIQKEQERYAGIKLDLEQDLKDCKKTGKRLEDVSQ